METQFNCAECGGNEHYIETGFYYCKECHTQAEGFRQAVFESQEATGGATGTKLSKKTDKNAKKNNKISTFETYNYIILGLVNEVIAAGAKRELRATVKWLWFKYLEKLDVIRDGLPLFSAVYSEVDAEVFYGKNKKRTKRKTSASSGSETESEATRFTHGKKKKTFIKANYEEEASQLETNSLANQSLTSLKSSSENDSENMTKLLFNKKAITEILKKSSARRLYRGYKGGEEPEKLTTRSISTKYKIGPYMLTRNKLYCLIYLGLLLIKDKIQLGDLLRLIREGHVSYNSVLHFFPEEFQDENIVELRHYLARKMPLTGFFTRQTAASLANLLEITPNIPVQNLVDLSERYCLELNLPREIFKCAVKLMAKAVPVMKANKNASIIPNYEARAISFLIFSIKLLFGLDDATEHKLSKYARIINNINHDSKLHLNKMFIFDDWMKHIQYRRCVLKKYHFPTAFANDQSLKDVDLFVDFLKRNLRKLNEDNDDETLRGDYEVYKRILTDLQGIQRDDQKLRFPLSFIPFRDYCDTLCRTHLQFLPELRENFSEKSVEFLLRPYSYLKLVNRGEPVEIKHHGANKTMKFTKILNPRLEQYKKRKNRRKFVTVKIDDENVTVAQENNKKERIKNERTPQQIMKAHLAEYRKKHVKNLVKMKKLSIPELFSGKHLKYRDQYVYKTHYNSFETFWISSRHMDRFVSEESFDDYLQTLPYSFLFLVEECARILEMDKKHLLDEYVNVELYLTHVCKFRRKSELPAVYDPEIKKLINKAKREW